MKSKINISLSLVFGFIIGLIFAGVAISVSSDNMLVKEIRSPYDFQKTVDVITERINAIDGWHVTGVINQNKEVLESGGENIGNFKIIEEVSLEVEDLLRFMNYKSTIF